MKPAAFDYAPPADCAGGADALPRRGAATMAGAQSLGPMLNLRLAQPDTRWSRPAASAGTAPRVRGTSATPVIIGAASRMPRSRTARFRTSAGAILAGVARGIAYRAVRNRGTIGGSLAMPIPAADWLCAAALGARRDAGGRHGRAAHPAGQRSSPASSRPRSSAGRDCCTPCACRAVAARRAGATGSSAARPASSRRPSPACLD